jgi:hypothetical protein
VIVFADVPFAKRLHWEHADSEPRKRIRWRGLESDMALILSEIGPDYAFRLARAER